MSNGDYYASAVGYTATSQYYTNSQSHNTQDIGNGYVGQLGTNPQQSEGTAYNDPPMGDFPHVATSGSNLVKGRRAYHSITTDSTVPASYASNAAPIPQYAQGNMQSTAQAPNMGYYGTQRQNMPQPASSPPMYQNRPVTQTQEVYPQTQHVVQQPQAQQSQQASPPHLQPKSPGSTVNESPRLDPSQAPSPIKARSDDQACYNQCIYPSLGAQQLPFSTTDYAAKDEGASTPKFVRSTMKEIPMSEDILNRTSIPFGLICQPFATLRLDEMQVPTVDFGKSGPVRCERCRAYINPFMVFIDGGKKYICNLCKCENVVPTDYYCNLDADGRRCDVMNRPELCYGTVDMVAPKEYCTRNPEPLSILFLIDVSITSIQSGVAMTAIKAIKSYISSQDGRNSPEQIAIMTFDRYIHYYTFYMPQTDDASLFSKSAKMHIISDLDDIFAPIPSRSLFLSLSKPNSVPLLLSLLENISTMFISTHVPLICTGAALQLASRIMESTGGRIFVFQNNPPNFGPGSIPIRDENVIHSSPDRDKIMFTPQNDYYQTLGESLSGKGISVDLFICPTIPFADIGTIGLVSSVTGGQTHCYFKFRPDRDEFSVIRDLQWTLYKNSVYDTMIRVRVGDGLSVREYFGNFYMRNTTDIEVGQIDSDYSFAFSLKYESKLKEKSSVGIQIAVLYTNRSGQRLIRLLNTSLLATSGVPHIFKLSDIDTIMSLLFKSAISHCSSFTLASIRQQLLERSIKILSSYRQHCSPRSSTAQLIIPDSFKLLPIYILSMLKSKALRDGRDVPLDKRIHIMRQIKAFSCSLILSFIYPRLYHIPTDNLPTQDGSEDIYGLHRKFQLLPLTAASLRSDQIFLLETGIEAFLWVGSQVPGSTLKALFSIDSADQIPLHYGFIPTFETPLNKSIRNLVTSIEMVHQRSMPLRIIRQQYDPQESEFIQYLCHDQGSGGTSYVDFLCYCHNLIHQYISSSN
jgi:protein transport protein SEC24